MARVLIIGYGNPLRGDDGLGWHVAIQCVREFDWHEVEVEACHQLTPELAEEASHARLIIFVDAELNGSPGQIKERDIEPDTSSPPTFSHSLTPAELVACAHALYGTTPLAHLITVTGQCFEYTESLSEAVTQSMDKVMKKIRALIREVLKKDDAK
jgi:hydrogenase maturation protease